MASRSRSRRQGADACPEIGAVDGDKRKVNDSTPTPTLRVSNAPMTLSNSLTCKIDRANDATTITPRVLLT